MRKQPLEVQTLYAELLERLTVYEAERAIGHLPGSFVTKTVKGQAYLYFQTIAPGDVKRQIYLGRQSDELAAVVDRFTNSRADLAEEQQSIQRLCALLRAGGAMMTDNPSSRVIRALGDAGVFALGGVLVGTHAFLILGNVLGVQWTGATLRTQDLDLAAAPSMSVAVPMLRADMPAVLESLEMGFLPVPGLDRGSPSTSFKVRGQGLRVDLLTPARRIAGGPVAIPRLSAAAQPLKFLDYVLEHPITAAVINGGATRVNVPEPARFAIHKLIISGERAATTHAKRDKDLSQAAQLLELLAQERPGDVALALEAALERGSGWDKRVRRGVESLATTAPQVAEQMRRLL